MYYNVILNYKFLQQTLHTALMAKVIFFVQCLSGAQKEFRLYSGQIYSVCVSDVLLRYISSLFSGWFAAEQEALKTLTQYFLNIIFFFPLSC